MTAIVAPDCGAMIGQSTRGWDPLIMAANGYVGRNILAQGDGIAISAEAKKTQIIPPVYLVFPDS